VSSAVLLHRNTSTVAEPVSALDVEQPTGFVVADAGLAER
jgi:hypothetical protein